MGRRGTWARISAVCVGAVVYLVTVSGGLAAPAPSVFTSAAPARSGAADPPFRVSRPTRDIEVLLWAEARKAIGTAGRSPLGVGTQLPLCQAIKGKRGRTVRSRGCGLPLLRPLLLPNPGLTVGPRPRGFVLSQAALKAFAAGADDAVDREWAKFLRRARQGEPAIDAAARRTAIKQADALRADKPLLSAAEGLRQAIKSTVEGKLARYRSLIRKYTTWLPGLRRTNVNLAAIRSVYERSAPPPGTVERTYTGPWAYIDRPRGEGGDWDTSDELQLVIGVDGEATNVTTHAKAGFDSWASHKKYHLMDFDVPANGGDVEVEIDRFATEEAKLDDCFGFASGSVTAGYMIYRIRNNTVDLRTDEPIASSWDWAQADALTQVTTCGGALPVPDPPRLHGNGPILRFTAPSSAGGNRAGYMLFVYGKAYAEVVGGGTAVAEQDLAIHRVIVRHEG